MNREAIERIVATVPNFSAQWQAFLDDWKDDADPPWFVGMSELAHYVVESYARGETSEFRQLFGTVESLLQDCDPELENLITVGLLEDVQNIASHREFGPAPFQEWLGPRSVEHWEELNSFWGRVADWTERTKPRWWQFWRRRKVFDAEKALSSVESPDLRKIIEATFRRKS